MVEICAPRRSRRTRAQCARVAAPAAPSSSAITSRILRVISAAAFSVKVMARIWLTSATGPSGRRRCTKRRASTAVFPEPAPARTAAEPATSIAARCSSVGTQLSGTGRLLLERWTLVAADGAVWAVRVAGLGIDVEAARARAPDQRRDARRQAVEERTGERPHLRHLLGLEHEVAARELRPFRQSLDRRERAQQVDGDLEPRLAELARRIDARGVARRAAAHLVVDHAQAADRGPVAKEVDAIRRPGQRECRPTVRIRERPLERPLHDALDRPSPRPLLGVLADDEGVHGGRNPPPGDLEGPGA